MVENWEFNEGSRGFSFPRLYYGKTVFVHHFRGENGRTGVFLSAHITEPGTIPYSLAQFTHPLQPYEANQQRRAEAGVAVGALEHAPGPDPAALQVQNNGQRVPDERPLGEGAEAPEGNLRIEEL